MIEVGDKLICISGSKFLRSGKEYIVTSVFGGREGLKKSIYVSVKNSFGL